MMHTHVCIVYYIILHIYNVYIILHTHLLHILKFNLVSGYELKPDPIIHNIIIFSMLCITYTSTYHFN